MQTICGTPQYVAPEILTKAEKEGYGKAVDMWSLGVILFVLLGGYAPFEDDPNGGVKLFEKIKKAKYSFNPKYWNHVSEEAKDLIRNLLVVDPSQRLTAEQALSHPWIAKHQPAQLPTVSAAASTETLTPSTSAPTTANHPETVASDPQPKHAGEEPAKVIPISARRKRNRGAAASNQHNTNGTSATKSKTEETEETIEEQHRNPITDDGEQETKAAAGRSKRNKSQKKQK